MDYFEVYEIRANKVTSNKINGDGSVVDPNDETLVDTNVAIEYVVYEYEEDGTIMGEQHYTVGGGTDEEEAIENIKRDHPADEWQNHNW